MLALILACLQKQKPTPPLFPPHLRPLPSGSDAISPLRGRFDLVSNRFSVRPEKRPRNLRVVRRGRVQCFFGAAAGEKSFNGVATPGQGQDQCPKCYCFKYSSRSEWFRASLRLLGGLGCQPRSVVAKGEGATINSSHLSGWLVVSALEHLETVSQWDHSSQMGSFIPSGIIHPAKNR